MKAAVVREDGRVLWVPVAPPPAIEDPPGGTRWESTVHVSTGTSSSGRGDVKAETRLSTSRGGQARRRFTKGYRNRKWRRRSRREYLREYQ